jgi:ABC-2 type transport system ATP-binding protein
LSDHFVEVKELVKHYPGVKAVDGISFHIERGEVFGFLGPNGAGKTTTIEMMEGLRSPDSGSVTIAGKNPHRHNNEFKQIIGVQLQASAMEDNIKPHEALTLFGSFYRQSLDADYLLEMVGLKDKVNNYYSKLSGGQKQRLSLAIALVNDPRMVFLDEPSTGLDAQARRSIGEIIKRLKTENRTVLLTTHYIEEAENLCDRVAIIDHGKIIALGTPSELISKSKMSHRIQFKTRDELSQSTRDELSGKFGEIEQVNGMMVLKSDKAGKPLVELIKMLEAEGNELTELMLQRPTLEDVFIELTGRRIRD